MVHIYNGILLSHKKEHISVISSEEDELESESESHSVVSQGIGRFKERVRDGGKLPVGTAVRTHTFIN